MGYGLPQWVERDFRGYLECGILAYGFARARCEDCGHERLIPFSCKGRGICPSCNARRMCEVAAHLSPAPPTGLRPPPSSPAASTAPPRLLPREPLWIPYPYGAWIEPTAALKPRGWAYNVVRIANTSAATYLLAVDGAPTGDLGAAAHFEARVLVRSDAGDAFPLDSAPERIVRGRSPSRSTLTPARSS